MSKEHWKNRIEDGWKPPEPKELKEYLKKHGHTCNSAADMLGVNASTISRWTTEKGKIGADGREKHKDITYCACRVLLMELEPIDCKND